eukprot:CAMPEP_0177586656 /NCGR_PEP_ID=MMETSP0419_2-20121207/5193_1 /TAXON_ID=582737 /ORGANISM="Tetraselmis sp., Strain GSL018" /LENGTH=215 /DNA_ID=CAMNT_0019076571 /DNA_START=902 /DNA_END=1550 /DNA_ORIENTATION=-
MSSPAPSPHQPFSHRHPSGHHCHGHSPSQLGHPGRHRHGLLLRIHHHPVLVEGFGHQMEPCTKTDDDEYEAKDRGDADQDDRAACGGLDLESPPVSCHLPQTGHGAYQASDRLASVLGVEIAPLPEENLSQGIGPLQETFSSLGIGPSQGNGPLQGSGRAEVATCPLEGANELLEEVTAPFSGETCCSCAPCVGGTARGCSTPSRVSKMTLFTGA